MSEGSGVRRVGVQGVCMGVCAVGGGGTGEGGDARGLTKRRGPPPGYIIQACNYCTRKASDSARDGPGRPHTHDASSSADRPSVKSAGGPERPAAAAVTVSERPQPGQRSGSAAEAAAAKEARNVALVAQLQSIRSGKVDGRSMSSSLVALPSGAARSAADTAALQAKLEAVRFRIEVPLVPGT